MEEFSISVRSNPEVVDTVVNGLKVVGCRMRRIEISELKGVEVELACPKEREREAISLLADLLARCRC